MSNEETETWSARLQPLYDWVCAEVERSKVSFSHQVLDDCFAELSSSAAPNEEFLRAWVNDLRTTNHKQARRVLRKGKAGSGAKYCCLGLAACETLSPKIRLRVSDNYGTEFCFPTDSYGGVSGTSNVEFTERTGLSEDLAELFATLNDDFYLTFDQIATVIEVVWLGGAVPE